jgi:hypothetical protein
MCPACEAEVARVFLAKGAAEAVLIHGKEPCAHVAICGGITFIPDPDMPEHFIRQYVPHPLVEAAYRGRP